MNWKHAIPQPPIPQFLQETLKDYPELIQEIQGHLNEVVDRYLDGKWGIPFNEVYEMLEDTLSNQRVDAHEAFKEAEQAGDSPAIYRAKIKEDAVAKARHLWDLEDLQGYFQSHRGAFE